MEELLEPGDILLVRGKELHRRRREWFRLLISTTIAKLTKSEYTHAAMYIGRDMIVDVDVRQLVMQRPLADLDCYDVYRVAGATDEDRQLAVYFCLSQRKRKYDYGAVVAIALQRLTGRAIAGPEEDPRKWFCSELVARALRLSCSPWLVTPGDLAKEQGVVKVEPQKAA
ncbi:hypothetical protein JJB07_14945 [Tumebacillus sp. ITR2]|uniref:Uncharacterized protein n=1 Tax=Tumebacillus amylolyticus TaxID=2801339 RepID=A0ABS1JCD6_9BACL|nr:hypothetical protein [Tumebacillus amylolyticus]MBL0387936.1 hypothetical protein [Tumebacillus amylolyticus]